jgi:hypothetical protein
MNERNRAVARAALALLSLILFTVGCKPFSGPLPGDPTPEPYFIQHLSGEGSFPLSLDLGDTTRDVYLTFVNPNLFPASGTIAVSGGAASELPAAAALAQAVPATPVSRRAPTPEAITAFNQEPYRPQRGTATSSRFLDVFPPHQPPDTLDEGPVNFHDFISPPPPLPSYFIDVPSHCRAVVGPVNVGGAATRTLSIWVADNCWHVGGSKPRLITPEMVGAIADKFLKDGTNDIYGWVASMLGPEWGPHSDPAMIDWSANCITIWLCDIEDDDSTDGGVVGYFWGKDNYKHVPGDFYLDQSHERVMFTIDAVMYANDANSQGVPQPPWDPADFWPEEIYSTLSHEFQHMISFYQRGVLRNADAAGDTWINEMASQVVEDLLSDKMGVIGPRGVDGADGTAGAPNNTEGRLPLFNYLNDISLNEWGYTDIYGSYSVSYAFGAWLARNYGGAMLLNRLMQCTSTGPASIEYIVSQATGHAEYFPRLMQRWSAAQLLSDATDAPPGYRYNAGTFFDSSVGAATYRLNLFNYKYGTLIGPWLYSGTVAGTSPHLSTSATLYRAANAATGPRRWTLDMPSGLIASVIAK